MRLFLATLLLSVSALAQGVRFDVNTITTTAGNVQPPGYPALLAVPYASIAVCNAPANGVPCTNYVTTYTDSSRGTSCPNTSQVVLQGTTACVSTSDALGNAGWWITAGTYAYTVVTPKGSFGPFYFTAGSLGGGGGVTWPATGDIVVSNGTSSPAGLVPSTTGFCPIVSGGVWTLAACGTVTGPGGSSISGDVVLFSGTSGTVISDSLKSLQGTGNFIPLTNGTHATNDCAKWDASGNIIDSGSACGGGGGSSPLNVITSYSGVTVDAIARSTGGINAGSSTFNDPSGSFTSGDVGKYIQVMGAGHGGYRFSNGAMTNGSPLLSDSTNSPFSSTDVGRWCKVYGAGAAANPLIAQIKTYNSANQVSLGNVVNKVFIDANASTSVTPATYDCGYSTLEATIATYVSATQVTLSTTASGDSFLQPESGIVYAYGTNTTAAVQTALDTFGAAGGGAMHFPQPASCPATAVACGYMIPTLPSDYNVNGFPGSITLKYSNVSLLGDGQQVNIFARGAWAIASAGPLTGQTVRGYGIVIGSSTGTGIAAVSNVTINNLHVWGMTDGCTFDSNYPASTTTGDGWDLTHKGVFILVNAFHDNIYVQSSTFEEFKGEDIYYGGNLLNKLTVTGNVLKNSNSSQLSVSANDLLVQNNQMINGLNGVENGVFTSQSVRQIFENNLFQLEQNAGMVLTGVDAVGPGPSAYYQIDNNNFDTIGAIRGTGPSAGFYAGVQLGGSYYPLNNISLYANTFHDCEISIYPGAIGTGFQVFDNFMIVDQYALEAWTLVPSSSVIANATFKNNSGFSTGTHTINWIYYTNGGYATNNLNINNMVFQDNRWNFANVSQPIHFFFSTSAGGGWATLANKNYTWENESCIGCYIGANQDRGGFTIVNGGTLEPVGPWLVLNGGSGTPTMTIDSAKEQDNNEIQIVNQGSVPVSFATDANMYIPGGVTIPVNGVSKFKYFQFLSKWQLVSVTNSGGSFTAGGDLSGTTTAQTVIGLTGSLFSASSGIILNSAGTISYLASTGTGNVARATSPSFVTPILGTPLSGTMTNVTGLPPAAVTSAQGNGAKFQLSTGSTTTNDCVKFDANGNTIDAGAACASIALTTTGVNGTPTLSGGTLNIPPYIGQVATGASCPSTLGAIDFVTGLYDFCYGNSAGYNLFAYINTASSVTVNHFAQFGSTTFQGALMDNAYIASGSAGKDLVTASAAGTNGHCVTWLSTGDVGDSGSACGSGGAGGGINAQTANYTLVSGDAGKLVTMNGSSITATMPASPPTATWFVKIENLNASALTIARNGLTINGGTSNITLQQFQSASCYTDNTNYFCSVPDVAGSNVTLTQASNGQTIASTSGGFSPSPGISANQIVFSDSTGATYGYGTTGASGALCIGTACSGGTTNTIDIVTSVLCRLTASCTYSGLIGFSQPVIYNTNTVASSATPAFNLLLGKFQTTTLTANITSFTITGLTASGEWCFDFVQNGTGGFTISSPPAAFHGLFTAGTTASKHNVQCFYSPDGANLYSESGGSVNQ